MKLNVGKSSFTWWEWAISFKCTAVTESKTHLLKNPISLKKTVYGLTIKTKLLPSSFEWRWFRKCLCHQPWDLDEGDRFSNIGLFYVKTVINDFAARLKNATLILQNSLPWTWKAFAIFFSNKFPRTYS